MHTFEMPQPKTCFPGISCYVTSSQKCSKYKATFILGVCVHIYRIQMGYTPVIHILSTFCNQIDREEWYNACTNKATIRLLSNLFNYFKHFKMFYLQLWKDINASYLRLNDLRNETLHWVPKLIWKRKRNLITNFKLL